jgi:NADPH-dependent 2,4-dienoyl-CoA reductase/sulfur reductase-like enzyme/nitrite reductase/ring-hydroxylating ferredoxin subunit
MPTNVVLAQEGDLEPGQMKQVTVEGAAGDVDLLLARTASGAYRATHAYCSHYGAPLAGGALSGERVVCPWHHACFHLEDGRQVEPPGQDGLPAFDVRAEEGDVIVTLPDDIPDEVPAGMTGRRGPSGGEERVAVVLGGGAAGAYAAEGLREEGFDGRVVMITADLFRPYDRINLSKAYLAGSIAQAGDLVLRAPDFYEERDIELRKGRSVEHVEAQEGRLTFANGETMDFDRLVLAPGGTPRELDVDGRGLEGVHTLRATGDSDAIHKAAKDARHAVVVGASFIGMECASSLRQISEEAGTDLSVTVVAPDAVPFAPVLGEAVGGMLRELHEEHGVAFRLEEHVTALHGAGSQPGHAERVQQVELENGDTLPADLVVVGIGVDPATGFVEGVEKADDGGIVVDEQLRARFPGSATQRDPATPDSVFAAGDVAQFPYWLASGAPTRIEHWRLACQHGRLAGRNAAGAGERYRSVPYFWTAQHGMNLRYVGHAAAFDEVISEGDLGEREFAAYYVQDGRVVAASGSGRDRALAAFEELLRRQEVPAPGEIADVDLVELLRAAGEEEA